MKNLRSLANPFTVTGEFASTNIDGHKRWSLVKDAKGWLVDAIRGLYLIVR